MPNTTDTINKRIAMYRSLAGYTQESAATALGMNKNTYARMERSGSPKPETLKKMAELFNVSAELILYGEFRVLPQQDSEDKTTLHDVDFQKEADGELMLTTTEKNCIKLLRNLSGNDRADLMEMINKFVDERMK